MNAQRYLGKKYLIEKLDHITINIGHYVRSPDILYWFGNWVFEHKVINLGLETNFVSKIQTCERYISANLFISYEKKHI